MPQDAHRENYVPYGDPPRTREDLRVYPMVTFRAAWKSLTKQERNFQMLQCRGASLGEIADKHGVQVKTVKNVMTSVHQKFRPVFPNAGQYALKCALCFQLGQSINAIMREQDERQATGASDQGIAAIRSISLD